MSSESEYDEGNKKTNNLVYFIFIYIIKMKLKMKRKVMNKGITLDGFVN